MNVLVLASTKGAYNSLRPETEIYVSLAKMGVCITIMTQEDGEYSARFLEHGISIINAEYKKKIDFSVIKKIKQVIEDKKIDIVYATESKSISNGVIASFGTEVKLVTYRGTTGGLYRRDPSAYLNALNPRVNGVVCVSQAVQRHVDKQVFSSKKRVVTIYKGHKREWYDQGKLDLSEFGTNENNFNIAFVANVRPHKGLIYLLEAAKEISELENIHILLMGKAIDKEPYNSAIQNSGMQERIHMTGFRNDVPAIIASCDVLVHASTRKEGLPRVILEALSCDTPVIASSNPSSLEVIEDGINGFITPIKKYLAIAEKIKELYENPKKLEELSRRAHEVIDNKMSHEITAKKYKEYFDSLVDV
ncbi:glycosyltransferase family 4 protein [Sulfurimonas sp. SAG-AH-194-I05]|nr:glycosyltransferase family 4 protein [Sulfurimonas sp. SAG-AH-194-I05]MDF1874421.1 glycosyltransferase family 4 protein [Sulfurimonas sp. SAG-AH-194-I05]